MNLGKNAATANLKPQPNATGTPKTSSVLHRRRTKASEARRGQVAKQRQESASMTALKNVLAAQKKQVLLDIRLARQMRLSLELDELSHQSEESEEPSWFQMAEMGVIHLDTMKYEPTNFMEDIRVYSQEELMDLTY